MNRVKLTPNNVLVTSVCLVRKTRLTLIANKNTPKTFDKVEILQISYQKKFPNFLFGANSSNCV